MVASDNQKRFIRLWKQLLRHKTVSVDPVCFPACRECAVDLRTILQELGFTVNLLGDENKPLIVGERRGQPDRTSVLIYGHYDVQDPGARSEWNTDPFEPVEIQGRIFARGAQDNKGQLSYVLRALDSLVRLHRDVLGGMCILIDSEEESGSHYLKQVLPGLGERLKSDVLLVCDTCMLGEDKPAIVAGFRGLLHLTVEISAAAQDLHSGYYGGVAPNAAAGMVSLLAALHDRDGNIACSDFVRDFRPPSGETLAMAAGGAISREELVRQMGVAIPGRVRQDGLLEAMSFGPTIEINGITSGFNGPSYKGVIPARARAKITARLGSGQDGVRCMDALRTHLEKSCPAPFELSFPEAGVVCSAVSLMHEHPAVEHARKVLRQVTGIEPVLLWDGGTIPVVGWLVESIGALPIVTGFGSHRDNIHAPNESFSLSRFDQGYEFCRDFLLRLFTAGSCTGF